MTIHKKKIAIYVPESLISGLSNYSGPVLFYMQKLYVEDGFALADDEFVTSIRMLSDGCKRAGISPITLAIMLSGSEHPL